MRSLSPLDTPRQEVHGWRADEACHEQVVGTVVDVLGGTDLLEHPGAHHRDPVPQRQRLDLVVRHVQRGGAQLLLEPRELRPRLHAQLGVEVRQRLIHEERFRAADDRAAHRHALALPARQVRRLAVEMRLEVEDPRCLGHFAIDLAAGNLGELECESHVFAHGHVRVQRVALEDHRDASVLGCPVVDDLAADPELAVGDVFQTRDHA